MDTRKTITTVIDNMRPCANNVGLSTITNVLENYIDLMHYAHSEDACMEYYYRAKGVLSVLWRSPHCTEVDEVTIRQMIEYIYAVRMEYLQRGYEY